MVEAMRHESFYTTGTWSDEELGLYVGWVVRRGSFSDVLPLRNERGDVTLIYSGEDFPDPETTSTLTRRGHQIEPGGASNLVHLYEEDPNFFSALNGRFQGLIVDRKLATGTIFNDRYGLHRLYYCDTADGFYFAAEAKALLRVRPELRSVDSQGMADLISCGCVLENRTLFRNIHVLPAGSAWTFRNGAVSGRKTYFNPRDWEQQPQLRPEDYYQELRRIFSRNLPRYFQGQERIAVSLTGGLDTRMVMAWQKANPSSLPCYTFGGMVRECRDVTTARLVAAACGQPHETIQVDQAFLSRFPHYAERTVYLTDGCVAVNHSADLYVNEKARQIAPVRMTGNYGGEVLRSVRAFKPVPAPDGLFDTALLPQLRHTTETYNALLNEHPVSFASFRQTPWHHYGLQALEQTQLSVRTPFLDNDVVRTAFRAPQSCLTTADACLRLIRDGHPLLYAVPGDGGPLNGNSGQLLGMVSRSVQEFWRKAEYAYDYGMPQWAARVDHLLKPFRVERLFLGHQKFCHYRVWYRDALSEYLQDLLLDPWTLARPYVQRTRLQAVVNDHLRGTRNYTTAIHKLLTLELIHRCFID
jgi:asparagine synthase (glutamine-hydrolysing)